MSDSLLVLIPARLLAGLYGSLRHVLQDVLVILWDNGLALYNLLTWDLPANAVVPKGCLGAGGVWPPYAPSTEGDSRCSCPALNAMANHGILPRSGRGITFRELNAKIRETYNFAPSFCFFVPNYAANMLCRDYWNDTFDLSDLDAHNCIEHDASLTREDCVDAKDQAKPSERLIEELLASGTGPHGDLTHADLSRMSGKRRTESKLKNGQFSLTTFHKIFGSSNSSTMLTVFGGKIKDLRPILLEERIPDGWQSRVRHRMGLTMAEFNKSALRVELGIREEVWGYPSSAQQKKKM
ncbi:chloroperoxidase-like protein [Phanerochaete sordida]|uniref:Chloroperoxidase-like protein n=1 Tax=Phanerochaete sordida TaxID=48140 RepID=A0A9P3GEQ8_9APHY|nr:chloroperoxidase-like protein [Phanerochaete sordida]